MFGSTGFVGRSIVAYLSERGHEVRGVGRSDLPKRGSALGHAIYCIGLTANFRSDLIGAARAHVCVLCDLLESYSFDSFLYISSTRVYMGCASSREDAPLSVDPRSADYVYNLSKLTGESLCLARPEAAFRVARLANVVGRGDRTSNFLPSLLDEARRTGHVTIRTSPQSSKDYIDVDDVCIALEKICLNGRLRVYNVASGSNVSNARIAGLIETKLGATVQFQPDAPTVTFPSITITHMKEEFGFEPVAFERSFSKLVSGLQQSGGER